MKRTRRKVADTSRMRAAQNRPDVIAKKRAAALISQNRLEVKAKQRAAWFRNPRKSPGATGKTWTVKDTTKVREAAIRRGLNCRKYRNTKIEQELAAELDRRGMQYSRNVPIKSIANVDFLLSDNKTVIECDGCYWHGCPEHFPEKSSDKDTLKTNSLLSNGYVVFRFWEHEILSSAEACVNKIKI